MKKNLPEMFPFPFLIEEMVHMNSASNQLNRADICWIFVFSAGPSSPVRCSSPSQPTTIRSLALEELLERIHSYNLYECSVEGAERSSYWTQATIA